MKKCLFLLIIILMLTFVSCTTPEEPPESEITCNHLFDEWQTITDASCTKGRTEKRVCSICGEEDTRTVAPKSHILNGTVCEVCGPLPLIREWDASATQEDAVSVKLWEVSENNLLLEIFGNGAMKDYKGYGMLIPGVFGSDVPWSEYEKKINQVLVSNDITHIGNYALERTCITSFTFPSSEYIENHGNGFLRGCYNLVEIFFPSDFIRYTEDILGQPLPEMSDEEFEAFLRIPAYSLLSNYTINNDFAAEFATGQRRVSIDGWGSKITRDNDGFVFFEGAEKLMLVNYEGADINLVLPDKNKEYEIIKNIFSNNTDLKSIDFADGTTVIPHIFEGMELDFIKIPSTVKKIDSSSPDLLRKVYVDDIESFLNIEYTSNFFVETALYVSDTLVTDVIIPDSITKINDYAFSGIKFLNSVAIHSSVAEIGNYAFAKTALYYVDIENGVKSIGEYAFMNTEITNITLPDSVTTIGSFAFLNCERLKEVKIGNGITEIPSWVFGGCTALAKSKIDLPDTCTYVSELAFSNSNGTCCLQYADSLVVDGWLIRCSANASKITIPDGVVGVNLGGFPNNNRISELVFPEGVKYICGQGRFSSLTEVTFPSSLIAIDNNAFTVIHQEGIDINIGCLESWCNSNVVFRNGSQPTIFVNGGEKRLFVEGVEVTEITFSQSIVKPALINQIDSITSIIICALVTEIDGEIFIGDNLTTVTLYNANFANSVSQLSKLETIYFYGTEEEWNAACTGIDFASNPEVVFLTTE